MSKASLARFLSYCLKNRVEIGHVGAFQPSYARSRVNATVRLKPSQFEAFERATGGKLCKPVKIVLNNASQAKDSPC